MIEKVFNGIKNFPYVEVAALPNATCKRGQRKRGRIFVDAIAAFDIETTKIPGEEHSVMFIWQFHIMSKEFNYTVLGRTWEEFVKFMDVLAITLNDRTLMIFDHNFNYEFSYIKSFIRFTDKNGFTDVFSKDPKHPIYAHSHYGAFEWRDSYSLFNTKLEEVTKGLPHAKATKENGEVDDFDYTKKRFSWTPLTDEEYKYCINDVYGLCEAVERAMKDHRDTLYSLPYTSTGYIRRDVKRLMYEHIRYNDYPADTYSIYEFLKDAYRGGNTHANRWYAGSIFNKVSSWDRSSSYPDVMINDKFPISPFLPDMNMCESHLTELDRDGYAYLMAAVLHDVKLKSDLTPLPYLSKDKVFGLVGLGCNDNGRIIECARIMLKVTDIDWKIIKEQYTWSSMSICELYVSKYDYLPEVLRNYIINLYKDKTALKKVKGMEDRYRIAKTKVNGVYGLSVQRVENSDVYFDEDAKELKERFKAEDGEIVCNYYNDSRKRPMPYRWGVWVSAWARYHLQSLIDLVGADFVYADTDSVKFLNDHGKEIDEFNKFYIDRSTKSGAYATDPKGVTHYMGSYEYEGTYDKFITMGAKKYADSMDGKIELTVSGVPKENGAKELVKFGGIKAFKEGTVFSAGKLRPIYNDKEDYGERNVYDCYGKTGKVKVTSNSCLVPTTYKLGYEKSYRDLLNNLDELIEDHDEIMKIYELYVDRGYLT